jgi:pimeloyl-ACP methyl ester carboxylesterase
MTALAAVEGAGAERVLVLHGWALDSGVWLAARALTDQARFTYAYLDFPGYGVNRGEASAAGVDGMARAALAAADSLGWDRFSVVGHSMGGVTAMRVATMAPSRVASVVALTPVSPGGTPLDAATYDVFKGAWADPGGAIKGALSPDIDAVSLGNLVKRNRASMTQPVWNDYLANWTSPSFMADLKLCTMPVTLFVGASDPFVTEAYLAETAKALPNGRLKTIAGAGHYPQVEQPAATVAAWEAALVA